jgi:hypothetical protein
MPERKSAAGLPDGLFFKPKIPIWVNFGGPCNGKSWYMLKPLEICYGHLVYFVTIRCIIPILVYCIKKNLATLVRRNKRDSFCGFKFGLKSASEP